MTEGEVEEGIFWNLSPGLLVLWYLHGYRTNFLVHNFVLEAGFGQLTV